MKAKKIVEKKVSRKQYTPEFKEQALKLAEKLGVRKAAVDLGIGEVLLHNWKAKRLRTGQTLEEQKLSISVQNFPPVSVQYFPLYQRGKIDFYSV